MSEAQILNKKLGGLIRRARLSQRLKRAHLAKTANLSVELIKKIETEPSMIRAEFVIRLMLALGLNKALFYLTTRKGIQKFLGKPI